MWPQVSASVGRLGNRWGVDNIYSFWRRIQVLSRLQKGNQGEYWQKRKGISFPFNLVCLCFTGYSYAIFANFVINKNKPCCMGKGFPARFQKKESTTQKGA